jgi:hypothetical protein
MKEITLQVNDDTAKKVEQLSEERKEQLSKIIDLWISEPRPILKVMEEMGEYAARQGLTKEKLDELLADE